MPTKRKQSSHKLKTAAEVGTVLAVAAVAGAYFLYGKDGAKNRRRVRGWTLKARAEALDKLEHLKEVSEPAYHKAVGGVLKRYQKLPSVDKAELTALTQELRGYWKEIKKHKLLKNK